MNFKKCVICKEKAVLLNDKTAYCVEHYAKVHGRRINETFRTNDPREARKRRREILRSSGSKGRLF